MLATASVFGTWELVENILLHLDDDSKQAASGLVRYQRVNCTWRNVIRDSPSLQKTCWQRSQHSAKQQQELLELASYSLSPSERRLNPFLSTHHKLSLLTYDPDGAEDPVLPVLGEIASLTIAYPAAAAIPPIPKSISTPTSPPSLMNMIATQPPTSRMTLTLYRPIGKPTYQPGNAFLGLGPQTWSSTFVFIQNIQSADPTQPLRVGDVLAVMDATNKKLDVEKRNVFWGKYTVTTYFKRHTMFGDASGATENLMMVDGYGFKTTAEEEAQVEEEEEEGGNRLARREKCLATARCEIRWHVGAPLKWENDGILEMI
ncbi:hypothetical protein B0T16DRAFT_450589 [Cercophora newfieldiana]|uniref:Uncharacterized protein n=1 Tax=Cercophora newfieldiana TaxID=92897 RepID=A0AA40CX55_9PEZI|nr:hypothetical protein B0T16DRAFT_450589 [Cercophora newfieldiana]